MAIKLKQTASTMVYDCMLGINEDGTFSDIGMRSDETMGDYGKRVLERQGYNLKDIFEE